MKALGIDIGGSGVKGNLVDTATGGLLSKRLRIPTPRSGSTVALSEIGSHPLPPGPYGGVSSRPARVHRHSRRCSRRPGRTVPNPSVTLRIRSHASLVSQGGGTGGRSGSPGVHPAGGSSTGPSTRVTSSYRPESHSSRESPSG